MREKRGDTHQIFEVETLGGVYPVGEFSEIVRRQKRRDRVKFVDPVIVGDVRDLHEFGKFFSCQKRGERRDFVNADFFSGAVFNSLFEFARRDDGGDLSRFAERDRLASHNLFYRVGFFPLVSEQFVKRQSEYVAQVVEFGYIRH